MSSNIPSPLTAAPHPLPPALMQSERAIMLGCGTLATIALKLSLALGGYSRAAAAHQPAEASCRRRVVSIVHRVAAGRAASAAQRFFDDGRKLCRACECTAAAASFQNAIAMGHASARAELAWLLLHGYGVAKSAAGSCREDGARLALQGQQLGCSDCAGVLAYCIARGWVPSADGCRSLQLARDSAAAGSRYGQYALCFASDSHEEAVVQCQLAAAQGFHEAQRWLGGVNERKPFESEEQQQRDKEDSFRWHKLAADAGNPDSCYLVAQHYDVGFIIAADQAQAIRYLKRARAVGHPNLVGCMAASRLSPPPPSLLTRLRRSLDFMS
jgi:TPR repeat protein